MNDLNALAAWTGVLLGVLTGAVTGLYFHDESWLGGYASWRRRLMRLGHISFFGIAALNFGYALTLHRFGWHAPPVGSAALAAANFLMPAVCYLSVWRKPMRQLFFLPVGFVLLAVGGLLWAHLMN